MSLFSKLVSKWLSIVNNFMQPMGNIQNEEERYIGRLSLWLQIILILLFLVHDILIIFEAFPTFMIPGMSLFFFVTFLIGRYISIRISTIAALLVLNSVPFTLLSLSSEFTRQDVFGMFVWLSWAILLAVYLLDFRETLGIVLLNLAALVIFPILVPALDYSMVFGSLSFLIGMSCLAILGSAMRKRYWNTIALQSQDLFRQKTELELYSSLLRHDMKNYLGRILGAADATLMMTEDRVLQENIEIIIASGERMLHVLDILKHGKTEYPNFVDTLETIAAEEEKAHRNLKVQVNAKGIDIPLRLKGSRLLPLVFENLFGNTAQYGGENPISTVNVSHGGDHTEILVSDNGPGIPKEIYDRLFTKGTSTSGSGLGLYLSKQVIESMGGTIEMIETTQGEGATFRIILNHDKTNIK